MAGRLGHVIYWFSTTVAVLLLLGAIALLVFGAASDAQIGAAFCGLSAALAYFFGLACRYILAGPKVKQGPKAPPANAKSWGKGLAQVVVTVAAISITGAVARYGTDTARNNIAGLTGSVRNTFTDSSNTKCFSTQRAASENRALSDAVLRSYCSCFSDEMADHLSNSDLKTMASLTQEQALAANKALIERAGEKCAKVVPN